MILISSLRQQPIKYSLPWLFSARVDLAFFFAPLFVGAALLMTIHGIGAGASSLLMIALFNAFGLGPFHQGSTYFFYFDKKNQQHFTRDRKQLAIYFAIPVLIVLLTIVGMSVAPAITQLVTMVWAIQHLVQQNIGIFCLYQKTRGDDATLPRPILTKSIWMPAIFFGAVYLYRLLCVNSGQFHPGASSVQLAVVVALGLYSIFCLANCGRHIGNELHKGKALNVPAAAFWLLSVLAMAPFAICANSFAEAFLVAITMHWFQYVGLNYMLVKNKYLGEDHKSQSNRLRLPRMSVTTLWFCAGFSLLVTLFACCYLIECMHLKSGTLVYSVIAGFGLGLTHVHYFLDAHIWKFRDKHQQEEVLPYLMTQRNNQSVSAVAVTAPGGVPA